MVKWEKVLILILQCGSCVFLYEVDEMLYIYAEYNDVALWSQCVKLIFTPVITCSAVISF